MANEQNLAKPFDSNQSREQAAKNGKKGGIASGKARREKKIIKEEILKRMKERDWDEIIYGVIDRAKKEKGDFETFQASIGQKPHDVVEQMNIEPPSPRLPKAKK